MRMELSKFAEWVDMAPGECGCRMLIDRGSVVETVLDSGCTYHERFCCAACGRMVSESTVFHGRLGGKLCRPVRPQDKSGREA